MNVFIYIMLFIFGTVLGSFLGVVGDRLPRGESIVNPKRSYCNNCKRELLFKDMIPVLSYIFSKGKCRYCNQRISFFYPIVELLTGLLFIVSYKVFGFNYQFFISIIIISLFIVIVVSDINYLIIPDEIIIFSIIGIFIINLIGIGFFESCLKFVYGLIMFGVMYLLMILGNFLFKKESLGGGDIKLMFVVGMCLDPIAAMIVIFISSFIALPISILLLCINKEHVIPYGPFIALSLLLTYYFQLNMDKILNIIKI